MLAHQYLALKYLPFSLLMGPDFQAGFKFRVSRSVLEGTEHSLARRTALAGVLASSQGAAAEGLGAQSVGAPVPGEGGTAGTWPGGLQSCDV